MFHGIRCRTAFAILGLSLLLAGAASAATVNGVVDLSDTPGFGDAGIQVALMEFDPQQDLVAVPTTGQWGLIVTGLLLATIGAWLLVRRRSLGGWGTGAGILLMVLAVIPNVVGTARSVDPVFVTTGAGGTYQFTGVAVGSWGISAYKDGYKLVSSSLPSGIVPVALNISSAGETASVNLNMSPDTGGTCAASGVEAPEAVPPHYWAAIKTSQPWNQLSQVRKAGTQILEGSATLVRGTGIDVTSVIVPIDEASIASNQSRNFVSHFDGFGTYLGSYIIDITSPAGHVDEDLGVVPDLIRLTTPTGSLIAEAHFRNGELISYVDGSGLPRTESCAGFAACLYKQWVGKGGWIKRICKRVCVSCFNTPALGSCSACGACIIVSIACCYVTNPCP